MCQWSSNASLTKVDWLKFLSQRWTNYVNLSIFIAELVYQLCQYVWWFSMLSLLWHLALVIDWLWSVDKDDVFFFLLHFIFVKTPSCVKRIRQVENFSIGTQTNCFTDGIKFYTQFCLESTLHNVSVQFLGLKLRLCKNKR